MTTATATDDADTLLRLITQHWRIILMGRYPAFEPSTIEADGRTRRSVVRRLVDDGMMTCITEPSERFALTDAALATIPAAAPNIVELCGIEKRTAPQLGDTRGLLLDEASATHLRWIVEHIADYRFVTTWGAPVEVKELHGRGIFSIYARDAALETAIAARRRWTASTGAAS